MPAAAPTLSLNNSFGGNTNFGVSQTTPMTTISPPPVSQITKQPLGTFGSKAISDGTGTPTGPQTYTAGAAPTYTGGYSATDQTGNTVNNGYSINTSGTVPSNILGSSLTPSDVNSTQNQYAQYVQNLADANRYSPDYIAAQQAVQRANLNDYAINNQVNNPGAPGDTTGQLQTAIGRARTGNALDQASANIALQAQTLQRTGNIAGAQALVDAYKPTTVAPGSSLVSPVYGQEQYSGLGGYQAVQGIQTVNNLAQTYPDAGIQPTDTLQTATQKAQAAPSFSAKQLVQVTLPGGGISFVNRNQIVTDPKTGQVSIIGGGQATAQSAAAATVKDLTNQRAQISVQLDTLDKNFPILTGIVKQYGLNTNIPMVNQINQKIGGTLGQSSITQLNSIVTGLKSTIAQIVSRGGQVSDKTRGEADALLPNNVSYSVLQDLYGVIKKEGAGIKAGYDDQIKQQNAVLNSPSSGGSYGGSSGNPFAAGNFF